MVLVDAMLFALFGLAVSFRIWRGQDVGPLERTNAALTIGTVSWLATSWSLALTHTLTLGALLARDAMVVGLIAGLILPFARETIASLRTVRPGRPLLITAAVGIVPISLWLGFILWRGWVIPPLSHDALSYHLPKAAMIAAEAGYRHFVELHWALRPLPVNYELLLSESLVWQRSDVTTEWLNAFCFVFVLVAAGALVERWWGRSVSAIVAVCACVAASPVALLHSGAHKNDLLVAAFSVSALVTAGRWISQRDFAALLLTVASVAAGVGVKPQVGMLGVCLAPFLAVPIVSGLRERRLRLKHVVILLVFSGLAFVTLGGKAYINNLRYEQSLLNARTPEGEAREVVPYGDWRALWQAPYVLLAAPFSTSDHELRVPWEDKPWFWQRYEIYFSHLGWHFSFAALMAPFVAFAFRRSAHREQVRSERFQITVAALVAFALMLPVGFRPYGLYTISLPRYLFFVAVVVFAWSVAPLVAKLEAGNARAALLAVALAAAVFVANAIDYGLHDRFVPIDYVAWARNHRGTRVVPFHPNRATSVVDRLAAPGDSIAVDADFGTWIYPAFGASLERSVHLIQPGSGAPAIPPDVDWVAIDRGHFVVWTHPDFKDLSQASTYINRGRPRPGDDRVLNAVMRDPRFKLVYFKPRALQAVFKRIQ